VSREIQKDLAPILQQFASRLLENELLTVIDVDVTPDLSVAKIYLSFMNSKDKEKSLEIIEFHNKEIRRTVAAGGAKRMKKVPELRFYLDKTMDHAERINKLLDNL